MGPFLDQLEARLGEMTAERLRGALVAHATHLPAAERAAFLAIFDSPPAPCGTKQQADPGDPTLLEDIDAFLADIDDGVYVEGFGFDPDYGEHRTFGDETWTVEMRDLFERAGLAFLAEDVGQAREAYRRLLEALRAEHDEGGFPGAGTPEDVLGGVGEAKPRYLRAVWEGEPVAARAAALVEAAEDLDAVGDELSLAALEAARREPLPDLDAVFPDLIAQLQMVDHGRYGFGAQARRVLAEVTERHRGVDGLADLARIPDPNQAEAYRDWVDGLVRVGRLADAEQAAREALERLEAHGRVQATLAQRLAALASARDDGPALLEARQAAWRADPTLRRLLDLIDVAAALDCRDKVVAAEADSSAAGPLAERPPLAASVLLLAGHVGEAVGLLDGRTRSPGAPAATPRHR